MDTKKYNCNNPKCEFYVPMGRVGSLVIQAPVVLTRLKISIPITSNIDLPDSYNNINTLSNKVFLSKPNIDCNGTLSIEGYIEKKIEYMESCQLSTKIPFGTEVPVNYSILPEFKDCNNESKTYYKKSPYKISFSIDSIDIESDSYKIVECSYENSMTVSIKLTLTQNQYVFIPEPEGDVLLYKSNAVQSDNANDDCYYIVGYDKCSGLIANKKSSKCHPNNKD